MTSEGPYTDEQRQALLERLRARNAAITPAERLHWHALFHDTSNRSSPGGWRPCALCELDDRDR